jgi:CRISPR/Cas system-associated endoribonuclease Cas2
MGEPLSAELTGPIQSYANSCLLFNQQPLLSRFTMMSVALFVAEQPNWKPIFMRVSAMISQWLVCYDVADNSARRALFASLSGYASPCQKSVFMLEMTLPEWQRLLPEWLKYIDSNDSLMIFPLAGMPTQLGSDHQRVAGIYLF